MGFRTYRGEGSRPLPTPPPPPPPKMRSPKLPEPFKSLHFGAKHAFKNLKTLKTLNALCTRRADEGFQRRARTRESALHGVWGVGFRVEGFGLRFRV